MLSLISVGLPKFSAKRPSEFSSALRRHLAAVQHLIPLAADIKSNKQMIERRQKKVVMIIIIIKRRIEHLIPESIQLFSCLYLTYFRKYEAVPTCVNVVSVCVNAGSRLCCSIFVSLHGKLSRVSVWRCARPTAT